MKRKSKFYHFGDSFAFNDFNQESVHGDYIARIQPNSFGHLLANHYDLEYDFNAKTGDSNELIFQKILQVNDFKKGDYIFINWSFFTRSWYIHDDTTNNYRLLKSTNHWFDENHGEYTFGTKYFEKFIENNGKFMDYLMDNNYEITTKLFSGFVNPFLNKIHNDGVTIINLFIRNDEKLLFKGNVEKEKLETLPGITIDFEPNYFDWLDSMGWKNEEEGHYTKDIQEKLYNIILDKIKSLEPKLI